MGVDGGGGNTHDKRDEMLDSNGPEDYSWRELRYHDFYQVVDTLVEEIQSLVWKNTGNVKRRVKGDCFNAGFATGLHLGMTPQNCVRMAQASSALNALGLGSQAILKDLATTMAFMDQTPKKF